MRRLFLAPLAATLVLTALLLGVEFNPGQERQVAAHAAAPPAPALPPGTPRGTLERVSFWSQALGRRADFEVYLPAVYAQQSARGTRFPALYLLHPPRAPRDFIRRGWLVEQADRLMAEGRVRPMLLVLPLAVTRRNRDDTEWANGRAGRYESFVLDVVRAVDRRFATLADRSERGIGGVSEGGYGALNIALHHLGTFSVVQSWSGYFRQEPTASFAGAGAAMLAENSPADYVDALAPEIRRVGLRAWIFQGEKDQEHPENMTLFSAQLARDGAEVHWGFFRGGHSWGLWRKQVPRMLRSAGAWFARGALSAHRGVLVRQGGQPAPWASYYHWHPKPKHG